MTITDTRTFDLPDLIEILAWMAAAVVVVYEVYTPGQITNNAISILLFALAFTVLMNRLEVYDEQ